MGFVFEGGRHSGDVEGWVARAREEMALLLARRLVDTDLLDKVVFVTDRPALAERAASLAGVDTAVTPDESASSFHFGRRLAQVIAEYDAAGFIYMSGGSGLLMNMDELAGFVLAAQERPGCVVANNVYSADMFGAADSQAALPAELPATDNGVPMTAHAAGIPVYGASYDRKHIRHRYAVGPHHTERRDPDPRAMPSASGCTAGQWNELPRLSWPPGRLATDLAELP